MKVCKYCGMVDNLFTRVKNEKIQTCNVCRPCRSKQMSKINKGRVAWNKGTKGLTKGWNKGLTKETDDRVRKISNSLKGHKVSKEQINKQKNTIKEKYKSGIIKIWNKGLTKDTDERVARIGKINSKKLTGKPSWNKGKKGYNIDRSNVVYTKEYRDKIRLANLKENQTEETLLKRRLARINYIEEKIFEGSKLSPNIGRHEKILLDQLEIDLSINIERQEPLFGFFADGYCKDNNTVFEVDEEHHYTHGVLREKDVQRDNFLKEQLGCDIIRIDARGLINGRRKD